MVEKSDHAGLWPSLYDPFRNFGARLADWLSPATEASGNEDAYDIAMELPGVSEEDIELSVENGVVTIRGEKRTHEEKERRHLVFLGTSIRRFPSLVPAARRCRGWQGRGKDEGRGSACPRAQTGQGGLGRGAENRDLARLTLFARPARRAWAGHCGGEDFSTKNLLPPVATWAHWNEGVTG